MTRLLPGIFIMTGFLDGSFLITGFLSEIFMMAGFFMGTFTLVFKVLREFHLFTVSFFELPHPHSLVQSRSAFFHPGLLCILILIQFSPKSCAVFCFRKFCAAFRAARSIERDPASAFFTEHYSPGLLVQVY